MENFVIKVFAFQRRVDFILYSTVWYTVYTYILEFKTVSVCNLNPIDFFIFSLKLN